MDNKQSSQHDTDGSATASTRSSSDASTGIDATTTELSLERMSEDEPKQLRWWRGEFAASPTSPSKGPESACKAAKEPGHVPGSNDNDAAPEDAQGTTTSPPLNNLHDSDGTSSLTESSLSSHDKSFQGSSGFSSQRSDQYGGGALDMNVIVQDLLPRVQELISRRMEELSTPLEDSTKKLLAEQLLGVTLKDHTANPSAPNSSREDGDSAEALPAGEEYDRERVAREQQLAERLNSTKINRFGRERAMSWRTGRGPDGETLTEPSSAGLLEAADANSACKKLARRTKENDPPLDEDWRQNGVLSASLPPSVGDPEKANDTPPSKNLPGVNPHHELIVGMNLMPAVIALGVEKLRQAEIRKARDEAQFAFQLAERFHSPPLMGRCAYYLGVAHFCSNDENIRADALKHFEFAAEHAQGYFPEAGRAQQWVAHLNNRELPDQSPPGSAKSWTWEFAQGGKAFAGKTLGWLYGGNRTKGDQPSPTDGEVRPRPRPANRGAPLLDKIVPRCRPRSSIGSSAQGVGERIPDFTSVDTISEEDDAENSNSEENAPHERIPAIAEETGLEEVVAEETILEQFDAEASDLEESSLEDTAPETIAPEDSNPDATILEEPPCSVPEEIAFQPQPPSTLRDIEPADRTDSSTTSDPTPELSNDSTSETAINSDSSQQPDPVSSLLDKFNSMGVNPSLTQEPLSTGKSPPQSDEAATNSLAPAQLSTQTSDQTPDDESAASDKQVSSPAQNGANSPAPASAPPPAPIKKKNIRLRNLEQKHKEKSLTNEPAKPEEHDLEATLRTSRAISMMRPMPANSSSSNRETDAAMKSSLDPAAAMLASFHDETRRRQSSDAGSGSGGSRKGSFASG